MADMADMMLPFSRPVRVRDSATSQMECVERACYIRCASLFRSKVDSLGQVPPATSTNLVLGPQLVTCITEPPLRPLRLPSPVPYLCWGMCVEWSVSAL